MTIGVRRPGEFCWINMLTPQTAQAREFFAALLGWTYSEIPGVGHNVKVAGHNIGGLFDVVSPRTPNGTAPLIGVLVKVDNADAAAAQVRSLGGRAEPPFDIMDSGRMAVCSDPNGSAFDIWESKRGLMTEVDSTLHGAPSWSETKTTDLDAAAKFYGALFGWTAHDVPLPSGRYTRFTLGSEAVAGAMLITPRMQPLTPRWDTYFTVTDAEETARTAVELGGTLSARIQDLPGVGRFCGITSPQGVRFFVIEYSS